jgi:hypothetical protein
MSKAKLLTGAIDLLNKGVKPVLLTGGATLGAAGIANLAFPETFEQDAASTLKRDGDKYEFDPLMGEDGGYRVKRGLGESLADFAFRRGDDIQEQGKANRKKDLEESSQYIKDAIALNPAFKDTIVGDGDKDIYNAEALKIKQKAGIIDDIAETDLTSQSRDKLFTKDINALRALKTRLTKQRKVADAQEDSTIRYGLRENVEARRVADRDRLDILESRLADRQFQQIQSQNNFQLQMDQLGLANRRYDMEAARNERRDRRETLGILLQGLRNVQNNLVNY